MKIILCLLLLLFTSCHPDVNEQVSGLYYDSYSKMFVWDSVPGATCYNIYYYDKSKDEASPTVTQVASVRENKCSAENFKSNHYYCVSAVIGDDETCLSNSIYFVR